MVAVDAAFVRVPLISSHLIEESAVRFHEAGLRSMVDAPLLGVPHKVYAAQAGAQSPPLLPFIFATPLARLEKILPAVLVAGVIGLRFGPYMRQHGWPGASVPTLLSGA
jgi:hypothetical protein